MLSTRNLFYLSHEPSRMSEGDGDLIELISLTAFAITFPSVPSITSSSLSDESLNFHLFTPILKLRKTFFIIFFQLNRIKHFRNLISPPSFSREFDYRQMCGLQRRHVRLTESPTMNGPLTRLSFLGTLQGKAIFQSFVFAEAINVLKNTRNFPLKLRLSPHVDTSPSIESI